MPDKLPSPLKPNGEWHSRNYLRHWEAGETPQAITFRLGDSLPAEVRELFEIELRSLPEAAHDRQRRLFIERTLDAGRGEALLSRPEVARIVKMRCCSLMANATVFMPGVSCLTMCMC
jgi:putative transposase